MFGVAMKIGVANGKKYEECNQKGKRITYDTAISVLGTNLRKSS